MSLAKRPAEATESGPIGSEKRIKTSGEQDDMDALVVAGDDEYDDGMGTEEMYCFAVPMRPNYRFEDVKKPRSPPAVRRHCHKMTDHLPLYCEDRPRLYSPPPPPTPEDVENNRHYYYCYLCAKYVDHDKFKCPLQYKLGRYRITDDGYTEDLLLVIARLPLFVNVLMMILQTMIMITNSHVKLSPFLSVVLDLPKMNSPSCNQDCISRPASKTSKNTFESTQKARSR